ncbi:hypothetical protein DFH09DRAFT_1331588 [Mycena vulgaris]|nr:hypothetical protein DFH09DRAFT_1331588 [Mycena vulgaris]
MSKPPLTLVTRCRPAPGSPPRRATMSTLQACDAFLSTAKGSKPTSVIGRIHVAQPSTSMVRPRSQFIVHMDIVPKVMHDLIDPDIAETLEAQLEAGGFYGSQEDMEESEAERPLAQDDVPAPQSSWASDGKADTEVDGEGEDGPPAKHLKMASGAANRAETGWWRGCATKAYTDTAVQLRNLGQRPRNVLARLRNQTKKWCVFSFFAAPWCPWC